MTSPPSLFSVLIVDLSRQFGGTNVRVLDIASSLHGRYPCTVAVLEGSPLHNRLAVLGLPVLPIPYAKADPRILLLLYRFMRDNDCTVVDAHNAQSQFWGLLAASFAGIPVRVSTMHSSYRHSESAGRGLFYEQIIRLANRLGCHFIAVSGSVHDYLTARGVSSNRVSLIFNGIRLPDRVGQGAAPSLRETLGWKPDDFVVLSVGRLEPVKGHRFLIDAIQQVTRMKPAVRCLIVGDGSLRGDLEVLVRDNDLDTIVHFTGFLDPQPFLSASNAFCLPSLSEGLPYAALEASAFRLPLLITAVGDLPRFFVNGKSALIVPPGDAEALSQGLIRLMDSTIERRRWGDAGYDTVRKEVSLDSMIQKTLGVYRGDTVP